MKTKRKNEEKIKELEVIEIDQTAGFNLAIKNSLFMIIASVVFFLLSLFVAIFKIKTNDGILLFVGLVALFALSVTFTVKYIVSAKNTEYRFYNVKCVERTKTSAFGMLEQTRNFVFEIEEADNNIRFTLPMGKGVNIRVGGSYIFFFKNEPVSDAYTNAYNMFHPAFLPIQYVGYIEAIASNPCLLEDTAPEILHETESLEFDEEVDIEENV